MAMSDYAGQRGGLPLGLPFWREVRYRREAAKLAPYIDAKFYLANNADVADAQLDASLHYVKYGWREGRDPSPSFSTTGYLNAHPAVALEGVNPLLHFVQAQAEVAPFGDSVSTPIAAEIELVADHIDESFYKKTYLPKGAGETSPAQHYCTVGWREGNDPSPEFSTSYYLTTNPDIRESGVNPYWHYLIAGREEGRLATHPGGWKHGVLSRQTSFDAYCEEWLRKDAPPELLDADALVERLTEARCAERLMISFGHDDYRITPGGVQLCIQLEERDAPNHNVDYLNLHPWQPLPKLAPAGEDVILFLVMNGTSIGAARSSSIVDALEKCETGTPPELVIHHLAGHAPEAIVNLALKMAVRRAWLWLHDYFTLCTSYALQRNNVSPCDAPVITSNACAICLFGCERRAQIERFGELFSALQIDIIAPSQVALDFWNARTNLRAASKCVHPHVELTPKTLVKKPQLAEETPVRIAFIGTPAGHKGWPVFRELKRRLAKNDAFEFWFLGAEKPEVAGLHHVQTHVKAKTQDSMLRAVADNHIDLVLHWATWRETFSFSTFEALAGGAFLITNTGSGNVAATIRSHACGVVLEDADALYKLAENGELANLARTARDRRANRVFKPTFSSMTHDLMREVGC